MVKRTLALFLHVGKMKYTENETQHNDLETHCVLLCRQKSFYFSCVLFIWHRMFKCVLSHKFLSPFARNWIEVPHDPCGCSHTDIQKFKGMNGTPYQHLPFYRPPANHLLTTTVSEYLKWRRATPTQLFFLTFLLLCLSVLIKHKICKNMISVLPQREHHH